MRPPTGLWGSGPSRPSRATGAMAIVVALAMLVWAPSLQADSVRLSGPLASSASRLPTSPDECDGVVVPPETALGAVMASRPAGTTFCLLAGTYEVDSTITTEAGDRVLGAGRNTTFIDGSGLSAATPGIFDITGASYFADLDVFGAPTPPGGTTGACSPNANCGKAFVLGGASLTLHSVDCHDNGGNCIGGGGSANVTVDSLDCWNNGNAYSMTSEFRYAACIKRAAIYSTPGNTTVTNSHVHDNPWVGIWCDFCKYGFFDIEDNRFVHNGKAGIQWEMSGGWTSSDHALIRNNVFRQNNYREEEEGAGVLIGTANDVTVESNVFESNVRASIEIVHTTSRNPPQPRGVGVVIKDNTLHADAIVGCGRASFVERLKPLPRFVLGLIAFIILLALVLLGLRFRSHPRLLVFGFAGVLVILFLVLSLLPLLNGSVACVNNA
jgi:hypothetical protein